MTREELDAIRIDHPSEEIRRQVKAEWDGMAKPLDSMGRFEELTARIGAILGTHRLELQKKAVLVFCADNGIVSEGISQSGQEVTAAVATAMGKNESSVCKMARQVHADVIPVDVGIHDRETIPGVLNRKIAPGTRNFLVEPAMTEEETLAAIQVGMELVASCRKQGYELLATGEMGIGNTTTSSAMAAAMTGLTAREVTGRGAGLSNAGLERKIQVIDQALQTYQLQREDTFSILRTLGGLDLAAMTGVFLGGAVYHVPIVMDGVISVVAALAAERLKPGVKEYLIPSHLSRERAAGVMLRELELEPLIDASMALGEGTGAVLLMALLDVAMSLYRERLLFSDIQVEQYVRFQK